MDAIFEDDDLGLGDETPGERLARENIEADLALIASLRRLREQRGLSQAALGELLGVSQAAVSTFENDDEAKLSTVRRYAHALGAVITHRVRPVEAVDGGLGWTSVGTMSLGGIEFGVVEFGTDSIDVEQSEAETPVAHLAGRNRMRYEGSSSTQGTRGRLTQRIEQVA